MQHDWYFDDRFPEPICKICRRCGIWYYYDYDPSISCKEIIKANKSHEWKITRHELGIDHYECIRCKTEGIRKFGLPETGARVYPDSLTISCSEIIMKKVLE